MYIRFAGAPVIDHKFLTPSDSDSDSTIWSMTAFLLISSLPLSHRAVLLASSALPTVSRGDLYKQIEWVLLDGHSLLLDILLAKGDNPEYIAKRCEGLSALIRSTTIEHNQQLAALQQKVSMSYLLGKSLCQDVFELNSLTAVTRE